VVAAILNGHCPRGEEVTVHLRGGDLAVKWENDSVYLSGPAETIFTGYIEV
jgi:diaminopimelate epimerase